MSEPKMSKKTRTQKDWTVAHRRANNSRAFHACVDAVTDLLHSHRLGTLPATTARLIVAKLAHEYGLAPTAPLGRKKADPGGQP